MVIESETRPVQTEDEEYNRVSDCIFYHDLRLCVNNQVLEIPRGKRKEIIDWVQKAPIDVIAAQKEKKISWVIYAVIQLIGFIVGCCYYNEELSSMLNHCDLALSLFFNVVALLLNYLVYLIYCRIIWGRYNDSIKNARNKIENLIETDDNMPYELYERLKTQHIERKLMHLTYGLKEKKLTESEFQWHTSIYCWGCGKRHTVGTMTYNHSVVVERTRKDGAIRKYWKESASAPIQICPECHHRLKSLRLGKNISDDTKWNFDEIPAIRDFIKG